MARYPNLIAATAFTIIGLICVYIWFGWVGVAVFGTFFAISQLVSNYFMKRFLDLDHVKDALAENDRD